MLVTPLPAATPTPAESPTRPMRVLKVGTHAIARSVRAFLRRPALLFSPVMQSLFFLVVYAGQLNTVGSSYLEGTDFVSFLLPLILLTGISTGASAAGTLVLEDTTSGYLDRLRMAHGSATPFITGTVIATLLVVIIQVIITIAGAFLVGYRPSTLPGLAAMCAILLLLGVAISLLSVAVAVRTSSASTTSLVGLTVFGLSFFTGVFAPVEQLAPWMRGIATFNPLTYIIDSARQLENNIPTTSIPLGLGILILLIIAGVVACVLAAQHARRNR